MVDYYNTERPHSALNAQTPVGFYEGAKPLSLAAYRNAGFHLASAATPYNEWSLLLYS